MIEIIIFILVIIYLYISYKALVYNYVTLKAYFDKQSYFLLITSVFVVLGMILGIIFALTQYKINEQYEAMSIPIPAAFFKYQNGKITDYVSPLTAPIIVINFFIGFGIIQITKTGCLLMLKKKIVKERV